MRYKLTSVTLQLQQCKTCENSSDSPIMEVSCEQEYAMMIGATQYLHVHNILLPAVVALATGSMQHNSCHSAKARNTPSY
jgi:hypothetical protein